MKFYEIKVNLKRKKKIKKGVKKCQNKIKKN
jgi:hypothetical protein